MAMVESDLAGPVNLGNPGEYTVLDLAEKVRDLVGSTSPITFVPRPEDDPTFRQPTSASPAPSSTGISRSTSTTA